MVFSRHYHTHIHENFCTPLNHQLKVNKALKYLWYLPQSHLCQSCIIFSDLFTCPHYQSSEKCIVWFYSWIMHCYMWWQQLNCWSAKRSLLFFKNIILHVLSSIICILMTTIIIIRWWRPANCLALLQENEPMQRPMFLQSKLDADNANTNGILSLVCGLMSINFLIRNFESKQCTI